MYRFDDPLSEEEAQNCGNRDEKPGEPENEAGDEDGGAPEVLGAAAQRVDFRPDAVDDGFDGGIEKFHQNEEQKREDEKKLLEPRDGEKERHGREHDREHRFFAEGGFVLPGGAEALKGIAEGVQKAAKARFSFERVGVLGFFVRHGAKD